ncbi:methyltransferase domain-containing protein [Vandammella animalimorsus]|uniref:Glycosyl transferase family 2 n=1 Tax=Vandammella animalimorsus TaxID=2029117 RepID=A0A2A2A7F7_9BURK|nr:methyltransferase domain-containing protein [Vandammella animalimorsus]PAT34435.1 glycosyl transferase family 2 [Vandammella animalimorsus]
MTLSTNELHIYLRNIDDGERTSLSVLVQEIAPGSQVLDLGCGSGALGQYLHTKKQCTVDGVTFNDAEAELARPYYRQVAVANLELTLPSALFGEQRYDAIVCADILEHLRQPQAVLADLRQLLKPAGQLLISIPNSSYAGLVAELVEGEFRYREEGLLDATHVRHFTRRSLLRLLQEQGWQVQQLQAIERPLQESEFKQAFDALPPAAARYLLAAPDALTYQFIVSASAHEGQAPDNTPWLLPQAEALPGQTLARQAHFSAQLYWDEGQGFAEERKLVQPGAIGQPRQTLRFALPVPAAQLHGLRLDPADRPGILYLHALRLFDAQQRPLWQWQPDADGQPLLQAAPSQQIAWGGALLGQAQAMPLILTGDDPWLQLPLDLARLQQAESPGPLTLEVELGWPMSADYLSLVGQVQPLERAQRQLHEQLQAQGERLAQIWRDHEQLAQAHAQLQGERAQLHTAHEALQARWQHTEQEARQVFAERAQAQAEVADLHQQLRGMAEHLQNMRNSRPFRYTRPLVRMRDWGRQLLQGPGQTAANPAAPPPPAPAGLANATAGAPAQDPAASAPVPAPLGETVDIVVPVYRGLADTQLCVESVLASPVRAPYRLIVINDCSPEPEVTEWLRQKAAAEPRITLLENEQNLGFVGTVNRGMQASQSHDVLLLNSDTEVANDWLDRLRRTAYAAANVGTVTPFSSNATICSYPVFCAANPLPPGQTTASLDQLFAQANAGAHVDVPTGVGFCMYIRRDCLQDVGLFDEEHFGKGYGEENDFCQRAIAKGWRNLHALDTYVLHTGGVSFGESKSPREQAAMQTLRQLHPSYELQVHEFLARDPARPARLAVDWLRHTDAGRKPIVLAVQHQRGGGTERHVLELAQSLAEQAVFLSLRPAGAQRVQLQLIECAPAAQAKAEAEADANPDTHISAAAQPQARLSKQWSLLFDLGTQRDELLQWLKALPVAHIHYHHLLGHERLIWELPQLLGMEYDFTVHDFYSFCTNISMTGRSGRYEVDAQGECCGGQHPAPIPAVEQDIAGWRLRNRLLLEGARQVLAPSLDAAVRIQRFAPQARVRLAPHTDVQASALPQPAPRPLPAQRPLRIAVIGALSVIKGADVLEAVARLAKQQGAALEFHLIGFAYRHLQTAPASALHVHGQYDEQDLPAILQRLAPDLVWLPAQWPETYSYTLSAALQQGLPVVVPDLGAFAERVAGRPWSWVLPWDCTPAQWLEHLLALRERHFLTGNAPTPPELPTALAQYPAQNTAEHTPSWDYAQHYLPPANNDGAPAASSQATAQAVAGAHAFARALQAAPAHQQTGLHGGAQGLRSTILTQLVRLRAMPALRPVARAIPPRLQTRVKSWLQR